MTRIPGIDEAAADAYATALFEAHRRRYGAVLNPYPLYARRPTILKAVRGMWTGLAQSETLPETLVALVNVRVAGLVGCPF
ncbi:MAG TPA: hypothetical protein VM536_06020 [Chloroflexia bacterium]|nr:hypothetical protein [Chloroflexia bacterium]